MRALLSCRALVASDAGVDGAFISGRRDHGSYLIYDGPIAISPSVSIPASSLRDMCVAASIAFCPGTDQAGGSGCGGQRPRVLVTGTANRQPTRTRLWSGPDSSDTIALCTSGKVTGGQRNIECPARGRRARHGAGAMYWPGCRALARAPQPDLNIPLGQAHPPPFPVSNSERCGFPTGVAAGKKAAYVSRSQVFATAFAVTVSRR
jgi:hypothetical protein